MIRYSLLVLVMTGLMIYAWKDWYKSLCGLIVMTAVMNHPDMPRAMLEIPGLSPFNILLLNNLFAWGASRSRERLRFNMPWLVGLLLLAYLGVVVVGWSRALMDRTNIEYIATKDLWIDHLLNTVKWVVPGLLLFDGARTPARLRWGLLSALLLYFLLALQVIKAMPLDALASGHDLQRRALKVIPNQMGYSRVNMSMMLAGGAWAIMAARPLINRWWYGYLTLGAFVATTYGQVLTAGRTGYLTWAFVGLVLGALRWRRYLLLAPLVVLVLALSVPAAVERLTIGTGTEGEEVDSTAMTSGRVDVWPSIVATIEASPFIGYGLLAMKRTGLSTDFPEFAHPHNAYLELLLDGGWLSLIPVVLFYLVIVGRALWMLVWPRNALEVAIGAAAFSLTVAFLFAGMGSQHFYPQMGSVGMWAAMGLMLRVSVDRQPVRRRRVAQHPRTLGTPVGTPVGAPQLGVPTGATQRRRRG